VIVSRRAWRSEPPPDPAAPVAQQRARNFEERLHAKVAIIILQDEAKIRAYIRDQMGGFLSPLARSVPRLLRAQLRQRLGQDPGHPLVVQPIA
jgi:hypothetical protein